jgi:hypothetical protein
MVMHNPEVWAMLFEGSYVVKDTESFVLVSRLSNSILGKVNDSTVTLVPGSPMFYQPSGNLPNCEWTLDREETEDGIVGFIVTGFIPKDSFLSIEYGALLWMRANVMAALEKATRICEVKQESNCSLVKEDALVTALFELPDNAGCVATISGPTKRGREEHNTIDDGIGGFVGGVRPQSEVDRAELISECDTMWSAFGSQIQKRQPCSFLYLLHNLRDRVGRHMAHIQKLVGRVDMDGSSASSPFRVTDDFVIGADFTDPGRVLFMVSVTLTDLEGQEATNKSEEGEQVQEATNKSKEGEQVQNTHTHTKHLSA